RFLGGIGVGVSSVTAPIYISEISPAKSRGKLVGLFQFNVVLGILVAYLSNYFIGQGGEESWRWMLGVQAFPALIFFILILFVSERPRCVLLQRGKKEEATAIMQKVSGKQAEKDIELILKNQQRTQTRGEGRLFSKANKIPIMLAVLFAIFNQVSGINAI